MANKYGISEEALKKIRVRDKECVYCHKKMINHWCSKNRNDSATIEHLNHLPPWNNHSTVTICCGKCNSSRGNKELLDWFKTLYCIEKNINKDTVSEPVKEFIKRINL